MDTLTQNLLLGLLAGIAIPVGGLLALAETLLPRRVEDDFRHFVMSFGGGALVSAVALVLVPEGSHNMPIWLVVLCFGGGGLTFLCIDVLIARSKKSGSQLVAMLADFIPEALALGAFIADGNSGFLLAFLIALQNLPEGFSSYRELSENFPTRKIFSLFVILALMGPLATFLGFTFLPEYPTVLKGIMLAAGGGILYIIFQDIAPQAQKKTKWTLSLGAVLGFLLGLIGSMMEAG